MANIDASEWGPRLHAYLENYVRSTGTNLHAWAWSAGLQPPTVARWKSRSTPSLQNMQSVADALGLTMLDVLIIAGVIDPADAKRPAPAAPPIPSLEALIDTDPSLNASLRKHLRDILASFRAVQAGQIEEVSVKGKRKV